MTIHEAISCLKADKEYLVDYDVCDGEEIDVAIEALEKAEKFKWIPVSERLPESYKPVLVQWSKIYPAEVLKCTWIDIGYVNSSGEFERNKGFGVIDGTVEAWMPLPEPFRKGDE